MPDGHGIWHFDEEVNICNTYLPFPFLNIYMCVCVHIYLYICVYIYLYSLYILLSLLSVCVCHSCCLCRGGCVDSGVAVVTWVRCCGSRGASCSCPCFTYRSHVRFWFLSLFVVLWEGGCYTLRSITLSVYLYFSCSLLFITLSISVLHKCLCGIYLLSMFTSSILHMQESTGKT